MNKNDQDDQDQDDIPIPAAVPALGRRRGASGQERAQAKLWAADRYHDLCTRAPKELPDAVIALALKELGGLLRVAP